MIRLRNMTAIYLCSGDKMLLLFRQGSKVADNKWIGSAGGHFEEHELNDPTACVLRELQEELGVVPEMLSDLRLRYLTIRRAKSEIRQNYYFFADVKEGIPMDFSSNEGTLRWFSLEELSALEMPFTAKYMMEHYLLVGRFDDKIYVGAADGEQVIFTEAPEF